MREWRCRACNHEFERIRPDCPQCHTDGATRIFLTPPRIQSGYAKRTDSILQHQFDKLGIANFSNSQSSGPNKVTWKPKQFGSRASGGQPEIMPMIGTEGFSKLGINPAQLMQTLAPGQTVPFQVPKDVTGAGIPLGVPIGGKPTELYKKTNVIGRLDSDSSGKSVRRVG
jgi:hypothetical protein